MKRKHLTLFTLLISILLVSSKFAYAEVSLPSMHWEHYNVAVNSGDNANGTYEPWVINGNDYPVKITFDLYCLYGDNGTKKFLRTYSKVIPANSGYVKFPLMKHNAECYWAYPTNVRVVRQ